MEAPTNSARLIKAITSVKDKEITAAFNTLSKRQQQVIHAHFGEKKPVEVVAEEMGVLPARIRQLRSGALKKMRQNMPRNQ